MSVLYVGVEKKEIKIEMFTNKAPKRLFSTFFFERKKMKAFKNALKAMDEDNVEQFKEAIAKIEDINGIHY